MRQVVRDAWLRACSPARGKARTPGTGEAALDGGRREPHEALHRARREPQERGKRTGEAALHGGRRGPHEEQGLSLAARRVCLCIRSLSFRTCRALPLARCKGLVSPGDATKNGRASARGAQNGTEIEARLKENRPRSDQRSSQNRSKIDLGASEAPPGDSGTPWDAPGAAKSAPGARQDRSGTLQERSRDALEDRSCCRTLAAAPADRFLTFSACRAEAPMCVLYHSCQCFVDVARFSLERRDATQNLEKQHQNDGKSRPGAPRERSERAKSRSDAPDRPEKRSASARRAVERIFFSQSNAAKRTRERNAGPARSARGRHPRVPV